MISRFVSPQDKIHVVLEKKGIISELKKSEQRELMQVQNADIHENNVVNDVCIDLGGCYVPEYMRDPKCYKLFKTLYKSLKRKDGPLLINKIVRGCEKNPILQNKLTMVKKGIQKVLQRNPDIDMFGLVCDYGFRQECMDTLGVTNQVDIFEAIERARDKKTIDYIISSRGGIQKTAKLLEEKGGVKGKYITLQKAKYLMDGDIPAKSIASSILIYDKDDFQRMVNTRKISSDLTNDLSGKKQVKDTPIEASPNAQVKGISSPLNGPYEPKKIEINAQVIKLINEKKMGITN